MEQLLQQLNKGDFVCVNNSEEQVKAAVEVIRKAHGGMFDTLYLRRDLTYVTCHKPVDQPLPTNDPRINRRPPLRMSA